MMEQLPWAAIAGISALAVSILLTIGFAAMCRRNGQQEQQERHEDIH